MYFFMSIFTYMPLRQGKRCFLRFSTLAVIDIFLPSWKRGCLAALDVSVISALQQLTVERTASVQGHTPEGGHWMKTDGSFCSLPSGWCVLHSSGGGITRWMEWWGSRHHCEHWVSLGSALKDSPCGDHPPPFQRCSITLWTDNAALLICHCPLHLPSVDGALWLFFVLVLLYIFVHYFFQLSYCFSSFIFLVIVSLCIGCMFCFALVYGLTSIVSFISSGPCLQGHSCINILLVTITFVHGPAGWRTVPRNVPSVDECTNPLCLAVRWKGEKTRRLSWLR